MIRPGRIRQMRFNNDDNGDDGRGDNAVGDGSKPFDRIGDNKNGRG